jgi:hypothetical protein
MVNEIMSLFLDTISIPDNMKRLYLDVNHHDAARPRAARPTITGSEAFPSVPAISGTRRPITVRHLSLRPHAETVVHHLPELQTIHMEYGPWDRNAFRSLLNALTDKNITRASLCLPELVVDDEWQCEYYSEFVG